MNKQQRLRWLGIVALRNAETAAARQADPIGQGYYILCSCCAYGTWEMEEMDCRHPVQAVSDWEIGTSAALLESSMPENVVDCWGFRPDKGKGWRYWSAHFGITVEQAEAAIPSEEAMR